MNYRSTHRAAPIYNSECSVDTIGSNAVHSGLHHWTSCSSMSVASLVVMQPDTFPDAYSVVRPLRVLACAQPVVEIIHCDNSAVRDSNLD